MTGAEVWLLSLLSSAGDMVEVESHRVHPAGFLYRILVVIEKVSLMVGKQADLTHFAVI